jgi:hypothetical protein
LTLIRSSINSFSAAWLGVSKKRFIVWVIPLLQDCVGSAARTNQAWGPYLNLKPTILVRFELLKQYTHFRHFIQHCSG